MLNFGLVSIDLWVYFRTSAQVLDHELELLSRLDRRRVTSARASWRHVVSGDAADDEVAVDGGVDVVATNVVGMKLRVEGAVGRVVVHCKDQLNIKTHKCSFVIQI